MCCGSFWRLLLRDHHQSSARRAREIQGRCLSMNDRIHPFASLLAAVARGISGVQVQWAGCEPDERQRIYFANHTSHLDFVVLWSALPSEIRARTRPIAAKDYWEETPLRHYLTKNVFHAVLVERGSMAKAKSPEEAHFAGSDRDRGNGRGPGRPNIRLILFPEGTRGTGEKVGPVPLRPVPSGIAAAGCRTWSPPISKT